MPSIVKLYHGGDECNTYIVGDEGKSCIVIDPGYNKNGSLDNYLKKHHSGVAGILVTHGHIDHIEGLIDMKCLGPVFMMEEDIPCLGDSHLNVSDLSGEGKTIDTINPYSLSDQDEIKLNGMIVKTIHTPFHTRGSCCFYFESLKALFSGDSLFHLGIGRSDFPGGSERDIPSSLRKLAALPTDTKVYPGHGPATTIGNELAYNEELQSAARN